MAVPSSGELSLTKIARERFYNDYYYPRDAIVFWNNQTSSIMSVVDEINISVNAAVGLVVGPKPPIFLSDLHQGSPLPTSEFDINPKNYYDTLNTLSLNRPDNQAPYSMSEFYGYNEDYGPSSQNGFYSAFLRYGFFLFTSQDTEAVGTFPLSYMPTDLTYFYNRDDIVFERFQSNNNVRPSEWRKSYLVVDEYAGRFIRPNVVFYNNVAGQFRNDVCISGNWVFLDADLNVILDNDDQPQGWDSRPLYNATSVGQRGTAFSGDTSLPSSVTSWVNIPYTEDPIFATNRWTINAGATQSSGTGPSYEVIFLKNKYTYTDLYRSGVDKIEDFWLSIGGVLDPNNNLSKYFYFESSGSTVGHKWFRWSDFRGVPSNAKYLTFCYSAWSNNGHLDFTNDYLEVFLESEGIEPPPTFS